VDGNAQRVLSRVFGIDAIVTSPAARAAIVERGTALLPPDRPGDFNQALMGLGNMICAPNPDCARCPVSMFCEARRTGAQTELPLLPGKPEKRLERRAVALVFALDRVLVRRKPDGGLLGGLWEYPSFADVDGSAGLSAALDELGATGILLTRLPPTKHVFSHLIWDMWGYQYENGAVKEEHEDLRFVDLAELRALTVPAAMRLYHGLAVDRLGDQR